MRRSRLGWDVLSLDLILFFLCLVSATGQTTNPKRVFMITDMEGVHGIFDTDVQCIPYQSPRFEESRKLLTGKVNAAVDGLREGVEQLNNRTWVFRGKDIVEAWLKYSSF